MTVAQRFLFETSFDAAGASGSMRKARPEAKLEPSEDAVALNEAAIEQARAEGYEAGLAEGQSAGRSAGFEEGRAKGQEEAQQTATQRSAEALELTAQTLQTLIDRKTEETEQAQSLTLTVLRTVLTKLYPVLANRHGLSEIEALLRDCLARLSEEPRVVVRVADSLYAARDERLGELAQQSGFESKFVLLSEPDLPHGDLRVEWADGGAERDTSGTIAEINGILDRALGETPVPSHPVPSQTSDDAPSSSAENLEG